MRGVAQQASGITAKSMERLQYLQSAACTLRSKAGEPAREPRSNAEIGVFPWPFGSSRLLHHEDAFSRRCGGKTAPTRSYAELEKGAQENEPQHPDACSVQLPSPI